MLTEPLKNQTGKGTLIAYSKLHSYLTEIVFHPKTQWLDNDACKVVKGLTEKTDILTIGTTWNSQKKCGRDVYHDT